MKFNIAVLIPFVVIAVANPILDATTRDALTAARADGPRNCQIIDLVCSGGSAQAAECEQIPFECQQIGLHPITANATCAAQCVCHLC
ncbi:hypothetical protein C8R44DRAFT_886392 [Mycena epipterygia]|nr:hypothetical protein C8R44DRAFT_886392 [Mycena epipterygia]